MGKGRQKYFIHNHKLMPEMRSDSTWAKQVCEVKRTKRWNKLMKNIPKKQAKMCIQTCATTEEIKKERIRNNIHIRNNAKKTR